MGLLDLFFGSPEKREKKLRERLEYVEGLINRSYQRLAELRKSLSNARDDNEKNEIQQDILDIEETLRRSETDRNNLRNKLSKLKPAMQPA